MNIQEKDIHTIVRDRYGKAATGESCCASGCCGSTAVDAEQIARAIGYRSEDLAVVPEGANLGLGCGNPLEHAHVKTGETVLDLGSGAGFDAFLAAHAVGPTGHVIGVDMTPEMIAKAKKNAETARVTNVEFRSGMIEALPVDSATVDVIISNCVINLSPDKPKVFAEALRVLKPGGRMLVSDLVLAKPISEKLRQSVEAYVGCVAGASMKEDYLQMMRDAGFQSVEVVQETRYDVGLEELDKSLASEALTAVRSVKVRAVK
jgi:arsenite methyltransferase